MWLVAGFGVCAIVSSVGWLATTSPPPGVQPRSRRAADAPPPTTTFLRDAAAWRIPIETRTLPNGLRVVVSEDRRAPLVTVNVVYGVGSRAEPPGRSGFAHFFEHLMFDGSSRTHAQNIHQLAGTFHGVTRRDYTSYLDAVPVEALDEILAIEARRMRTLTLTPAHVRRQREIVGEEFRQNVDNQPHGGLEWSAIHGLVFSRWPNAHPSLGTHADLDAVTAAEAERFHLDWYGPNNAVLVVAGAVTAGEVMTCAAAHFGAIAPRPTPAWPDASEPSVDGDALTGRHKVVRDALAERPAMAIGWAMPPEDSIDYRALVLAESLLLRDPALLASALARVDPAAAVRGGIHPLGLPYDVTAPTPFVLRVDHRRAEDGARLLQAVDEVMRRVAAEATEEDLVRAKTAFARWWLDEIDGGRPPFVSRTRLLGFYGLRDRAPDVNLLLTDTLATPLAAVRAAVGRWWTPARRHTLESHPAALSLPPPDPTATPDPTTTPAPMTAPKTAPKTNREMDAEEILAEAQS